MTELRGLIVDFGGVLTSPIADAVDGFCVAEGLDPTELTAVIAAAYVEDAEPGEMAALETGALSLAEFELALAGPGSARSRAWPSATSSPAPKPALTTSACSAATSCISADALATRCP